jgi:predicted AlkP superfamily phosphohydrolase/phosphomutase
MIIGLDGADWRILQPLINAGKLPALAGLIQEGCHGPLRSTIRPESSVAWSSFATGVWPGEHGVFSFLRHEDNSYNFKLANASSIGAPRFWKPLGDAGHKVGLVNVPFSYPPQPINGFLVGGMMTPGIDVAFTHPPDLQERILARFPEYMLDAADDIGERKTLIESADNYTRQQLDLALFLMREEEWDVFTIVFTALDRLQHYFWRDMDPLHPAHDSEEFARYGQVIESHLVALDDAVARLVEESPEGTLTLVMSDHGFNGCANRFYRPGPTAALFLARHGSIASGP